MKIEKIVTSENQLPHGADYEGQIWGVGHPNIHNVYKYHWDKRRGTGNWGFIMMIDTNEACSQCGK